ncbi:MAG TPA: hypothetical protein VM680_03235 [Verrucomicrobiae bacterium]|nr:hypothetical protein [Verrucomicrobiae bacterium]
MAHSADVGTNTIISEDPSPNPVALDTDSANSNNLGGGDLAASCASQTNYATSALSAASNVRVVVVTNISGSFVYTVETDVSTRSESQPSSVTLRLKSSATVHVFLQLKSPTAFVYKLAWTPNPVSQVADQTISIRTDAGHTVFSAGFIGSIADLPEAQGKLAAGVYQIDYWTTVQGEGAVYSGFVNDIQRWANATLSLTITPELIPTEMPILKLRPGTEDTVILEMTNLEPGVFYFIARNQTLIPWTNSIFANFIAGGTNATLIDTVYRDQPAFFYRVSR